MSKDLGFSSKLVLNKKSMEAVGAAQYHQKFKRPLYENYCFSRIPGTIRQALTWSDSNALPDDTLGELKRNYETVILLFIDAFGWRFLEPLLENHPFLKHFLDRGVVSQLTSQFPSTTAAHVTALNTGLPVGEHGVYEWFFYEPKVDRVIAPLLFSYAIDGERETLLKSGIDPKTIFQKNSFYEELQGAGVNSFIFLPRSYARSSYGSVYCEAAKIVPYSNFKEIEENLERLLKEQRQKSYYYLYLDQFDTACHKHSPSSKTAHSKALEILDFLEDLFLRKLSGKLKNCLLLMSADHGHIEVDPKKSVFVDDEMPEIIPLLKTNRQGEPIIACGSSRDFFLHIKSDCLDQAQEILGNKLKNIALVLRVEDLIKEGFFGPTLSEVFLSRVANLVILPFEKEAVWWNGKGVYQEMIDRDFGQHGGLSSQEMEIGFLACSYN